ALDHHGHAVRPARHGPSGALADGHGRPVAAAPAPVQGLAHRHAIRRPWRQEAAAQRGRCVTEAEPRPAMGAVTRWAFVVFMLALTVLFGSLGVWQVNRLGEKEALIAAVEERAGLDPVPLPPAADWPAL